MKLTRMLAVATIIYCLSLILCAPASAIPQKKVEYSVFGFSIGGGTFDLSVKDNVVIFRTITPALNLITLTLDETPYFGIVECYTDMEFNLNAWRGTMLTIWEMQFYEQIWFTPDDPCVGTLSGVTIAHLTNINEAFLLAGTGVQQGSRGTGVMEGVEIHGYEVLYPDTITLPAPIGEITTTCFTVEGRAIL